MSDFMSEPGDPNILGLFLNPGHDDTVAYAKWRCMKLGIELPEWAEYALRKYPELVGVISDAVCVQAGIIHR